MQNAVSATINMSVDPSVCIAYTSVPLSVRHKTIQAITKYDMTGGFLGLEA